MNENKKQALKMFLDYIFEENGKTTEIETIVETCVHKKLKDYFDIVANKIDEISDENAQLKKDFRKVYALVNAREKQESKVHTQDVPEKVAPLSKADQFKGKVKNKSNKSNDKTQFELIMDELPEYTPQQIKVISRNLKNKYTKKMNKTERDELLKDYITAPTLVKLLNKPLNNVNATLSKLVDKGEIKRLKVDESYLRSPVIYYKHKSEAPLRSDGLYEFKDTFSNPGYDLINGLYVKPQKGNGKPLQLNAKQLYNLRKLIYNKQYFTVSLHAKLIEEIKKCGIVNDGTAEAYCYRLVKGFFDRVLNEYKDYQHLLNNPHFERYDKYSLRINGCKVCIKHVKDIIRNIPYGSDVKEYTQKCVDKYPDYPSVIIHTIIDNADDYLLKRHLKNDEKFVENNPQKRRAKGII